MHKAPSVEYPVGPCAFERGFQNALALVWLVGVQGGWWLASEGEPLPGAWWLSLALGIAAWRAARWRSRRPPLGLLSWLAELDAVRRPGRPEPEDGGGRWVWRDDRWRHGTPLAGLDWVLDLQAVVLLRVCNETGHRWWVWAERRSDPARWDDLRRALVVSRRHAGR